jgi:transcriptional regulator with AAA-type ATPase domain/polyferredoxin
MSSPDSGTNPPALTQDPFQDLSKELRAAVWERGRVRTYPPEETVVAPGDDGSVIRFLLAGTALVVLHDQDGQDIMVESLRPGDLIGEVSYLTGRPSPLHSEVMAQDLCTVLEIPASEFQRILTEYPDAAIVVLRSLARKVIRLDQSVSRNIRKKRALQTLISRQDHLFPDYFVSQTVRRRTGKQLEELARWPGPVLITGETGVGKEFMAHAIYGMSSHHKRVFLFLDLLRPFGHTDLAADYCELPDLTCDSTEEQTKLFLGFEKNEDGHSLVVTPGYLELTEEGTLLVRGIEQLTPALQVKLLKTLQTRKFYRVGGTTEQSSDFRLIGTTNLDSSEISLEKHPLLYWLLGHSLDIPPLRKRRKEIPVLVQHYVNQCCQELHKEVRKLPKETLKTLVTYSWPGNDRELATTIKRAVLLSEDGVLRPQDVYFDVRRIEGEGKVNLMRLPAVRAALKSPLFPAIFQSAAAPFFLILLVLLFLGPVDPLKNLGGLFSWAVGWPTMVFGAFLWARFWCSICPMGTLSWLAKRVLSLNIPFPSFLKHHSDGIVAGSALFIVWLETATDIRNSPLNTGLLLLTISTAAVLISVVFERQSWCRYLCPLGGMMGVFAKVSPFELRADRNLCASQCTSNECFVGTADREGCPFGQLVPTLRSNRFCKLCATCVKNCPHGAINLNLRVPGREIWEMKQVVAVTALLVISLYGGLLSDMLHKGVVYTTFSAYVPNVPELVRFTLFFAAVVGAANLVVLSASAFSSLSSSDDTIKDNFARYGLALLPLVFTGYMAFHLYYLINLGVHFPMLLWQTFQFEIFRQLIITVPPEWTLFIQRLFVWIGLTGSIVMAYRLSRGKHDTSSRSSIREFLPHAIVAVCFALVLLLAIKLHFY